MEQGQPRETFTAHVRNVTTAIISFEFKLLYFSSLLSQSFVICHCNPWRGKANIIEAGLNPCALNFSFGTTSSRDGA